MHIACLQETHLKAQEQKLLGHVFKGQVYHSPSKSQFCGVMIGVSGSLPWILSQTIIDQEGRYVIIKRKINLHELTIAGLYATHKQQYLFWDKFFSNLLQIGGKEIVLLGHFNAIFNNVRQISGTINTRVFSKHPFYRYYALG